METPSVVDIRKLNRKKEIIRLLDKRGYLSKNDLSKMTRHSISTVITMVDELNEQGFITQCNYTQPGIGRPPVYYTLCPDYGYFIGIDFNSESIHIAFSNLSRVTVCTARERMRPAPATLHEILDKIIEMLDAMLAKFEKPPQLFCIGMCLPGLLDNNTNRLIYYSRFPKEQNVDIISAFSQRYHCPVYVDRSLNCLCLAYQNQTAKPSRDMILLSIRTGVGMSCILNGHIFRGHSGQAGEIGHMRIPGSSAVCKCGKIGCLEAEVSADSITRKMDLAIGQATDEHGAPLSSAQKMENFVQLVQQGQPDCLHILDECCYYLSYCIGLLINLFNPSEISFYGEITQCGQTFLDALSKYIRMDCVSPLINPVSLSLTKLSSYAFAEGAAHLAFHQYFAPTEVVGDD